MCEKHQVMLVGNLFSIILEEFDLPEHSCEEVFFEFLAFVEGLLEDLFRYLEKD